KQMTVKRFVGATARDCLRRVKEALGPDAVVISNRAVENGVEIVAMSPESLDAISQQMQPTAKISPTPYSAPLSAKPSINPLTSSALSAEESDYTVTLSSARQEIRREPSVVRPWSPFGSFASSPEIAEKLPSPATSDIASELPPPLQAKTQFNAVAAPLPAAAHEDPSQTVQLMDEMRAIKKLLEHQLAGFAWGEVARDNPMRALLLGEMLAAGFSGGLARRLVQEMPTDVSQEECRKWLTAAINRRLRTLASEVDFIDRGGVYALVGPTGVGKTTTTAKLAARCVVRHGADRLALVTTDSYRIGAHEQLRIYGRILGVPVFVVRDGEELQRTLDGLREKHMVLIDTGGMSQRDRMVTDQAAMLTRSGEVNRLLLLNAGSRGDMLDDVVRAYGGDDLAGCILTKVDEATALAPSIDCIVRHGLTLSYVANGQRVPEDLHLPNRKYLLHRAFKVGAGETAHTLRKEEIALAMVSDKEMAREIAVA
ncbi:MAG TPA: flagellar biosynthesis protein FlhF, partial [Rugosibacter sp.]